MKLSLREISDRFDLSLHGDGSVEITNIASIENAGQGDLVFLFSSAHRQHLAVSRASAVVIRENDSADCELPCLISDQPRLAWARIATLFDPLPAPDGEKHFSASVSDEAQVGENVTLGPYSVISSGAKVGDNCAIGAGCIVGEGVHLGEGCRLFPNVTLYHNVFLGARITIHSGAVIGADGFGFELDGGKFIKIPQVYGVVIGDDAEIGAGTTIDRGALKDTTIGSGVKIDNHVQVGHASSIGSDTVISGCTAIAGSTSIGKNCQIGGAVGIVDNIEITDQVEVTAMSLVSQSITEKGRYSSGTGLMPGNEWKRNIVGFKQLARLLRRVRKLETGKDS